MEVKVKVAELEVRTAKLTKSLLKQLPPVEQFRANYLPGGKEAQDDGYQIVGWVHGSVLEGDESYWKWLIVQLRKGDYVRIRVEDTHIAGLNRKFNIDVKQVYIV